MGILNIPPGLGPKFRTEYPGFWEWLTGKLEPFIETKFASKGDVTLLTAGKGLHLVSPDGSKYYVTVTNVGALVVTPE